MCEFRSSRLSLFPLISVILVLSAVTLLPSGFSQVPGTLSVSSILLGTDKPLSMAIDEKSSKMYELFSKSTGEKNLINVIDINQNKVIDTIKVGSQKSDFLSSIALDPSRKIIYAIGQHLIDENGTNVAYDTLYVMNSTNNKFKMVELYGETEEGKEGSLAGISVNPVTNMIYIGSLYAEGGKPGLYVIDGSSLQPVFVDKWESGIKDIQLDPESHLLYVGAKYDNLISIIDELNNQVIDNISAPSPIAITLNKEEKILYEAGTDGKVNAIDLSNKKIISSIEGEFVKNIMYSPNDKFVYIIDQNMTNILSKNSAGPKSVVIAVNTTDNQIKKFETDFNLSNIVINSSTNKAYILGYDGNDSKLFIVKPS